MGRQDLGSRSQSECELTKKLSGLAARSSSSSERIKVFAKVNFQRQFQEWSIWIILVVFGCQKCRFSLALLPVFFVCFHRKLSGKSSFFCSKISKNRLFYAYFWIFLRLYLAPLFIELRSLCSKNTTNSNQSFSAFSACCRNSRKIGKPLEKIELIFRNVLYFGNHLSRGKPFFS